MGNSASSQGSSTGTHDGDVGSSISEEQHDWPIEQAADTPEYNRCRRCENLTVSRVASE